MKTFGEKITLLRKQNGLNQKDVADNVGVSRPSYSDYENDRTEPKFNTIVLIADFFEVSTDFLLKNETVKGKVNENEDFGFSPKKGKVKGKVMGKVIVENRQNPSSMVSEPDAPYGIRLSENERQALREVITTKNQLIQALEDKIKMLEEQLKLK